MDIRSKVLIKLARGAIAQTFTKVKVEKEDLLKRYPYLSEIKATFVTLTIEGKLRGCIGSLIAHRTLLEDLIYNARAAAFSDPRFTSLTKQEFEKTKIEISILTEPQVLEYSDFNDLKRKLIPNKHGVILELHGHKATFLPQVWEQMPTFEQFMVSLCEKAGLHPKRLPGLPKIEVYEVVKISEY